jgi:leucyl aminopeptidase (aminopeptidase T)
MDAAAINVAECRRRRSMTEPLTGVELQALLERVFDPREPGRCLAILVDLPDAAVADTPEWRERRELAAGWAAALAAAAERVGYGTDLVLYRNVRAANAELPATAWIHRGAALPASADALDPAAAAPFPAILERHTIVLAPTQFSTTAPLKLWAKKLGFRAATMPGFGPRLVPALRLDYAEVDRRVRTMKALLDRATAATIRFAVDGSVEHRLTLDLRHRTAHASSGLFPEPGTAGNLPSGEAYIVPYEGERAGDPTASAGELPVQIDDDVVVYHVERNRAVSVAGAAAAARAEAELLRREPAYGNLAELGLGVLGDLGVQPTGDLLLDEKLGMHIAFGRSDHFGGQVGPKDFSRPEAVVHLDRVYMPSLQPRVIVRWADLEMPEGPPVPLMRDGAYVVAFG